MHNKDKWIDRLALRRDSREVVIKEKKEEKQIQLSLYSFRDNTGNCSVSSRHPWPCRAPGLLQLWDAHAAVLSPQLCHDWSYFLGAAFPG